MSEGLDRSSSSWSSSNSLPDYIASLYYRYGIFVASNPLKGIVFAITSFLLISTPLWYLPFPGYLPQDYVTSIQNYSVPPPAPEGGIQLHPSSTPAPLWYQGSPVAYIQQVIVRSAIIPWQRGITVGESVRAPLFSVFHLSQIINDFHLTKGKNGLQISLGSDCLLVEGVVQESKSSGPSLPNYNCLILSPADLWGRDPQSFMDDQNVLLTVKSLKGNHEEEASIADILFGLPSQDIGISSSPNHPQVINYAITIALKHYSEKFVTGLKQELTEKFPLFQPVTPQIPFITHIYFPSQISFWEILILIFYCFLFSSIYFSFLKMKGLYSKCGLAVCIMATLVASICIATSISAHFGLRPLHSRGKYFYPVLAALIGFENSMVLVRAILSIPDHLDVKIRVAQGLAREGWTMTKYFFTMITFVTLSFFLFIPLVQEICIYGSLVLLCDLYLQLLFVTAVMAVDLQRSQATENHKMKEDKTTNPLFRYPAVSSENNIQLVPQLDVYKSCVPNLHRRHTFRGRKGEDILAPPQAKPKTPENIPKRLRLTYFVARKRMFQRMFMCAFIGWIAWMVYTSELARQFSDSMDGSYNRNLAAVIFSLTNRSNEVNVSTETSSSVSPKHKNSPSPLPLNYSIADSLSDLGNHESLSRPLGIKNDNITRHLMHTRRSFVRRLPISHWPVLFRYYNISLRGQYLSILPPILLSLPINPEYAKSTFNPHDPNSMEWIPKYIESSSASNFDDWKEELAIVPTSNLELFITSVLVIPALAVLVYVTIVLYRCICSRNYAEWRASHWSQDSFHAETFQIIGEAVPLILAEHPHDIECMCTDGSIIISSCLAGIVCAWDPCTGECIASINRRRNRNSHCGQDNYTPDGHCSPFSSLQSSQSVPLLLDVSNSSTPDTIKSEKTKPVPISSSQNTQSNAQHEEMEGLMIRNRKDGYLHEMSGKEISKNVHDEGLNSSYSSIYATSLNMKCRHARNLSAGNLPQSMLPIFCKYNGRTTVSEGSCISSHCSPIWCMECQDGFVYIGTGSGILEMWDVYSSTLKCIYDDQAGIGVTLLKVQGLRIIAAKLNGSVDILKIESVVSPEDTNSKNGHSRHSFCGYDTDNVNGEEKFSFVRLNLIKAHQQPISVLSCDNTRIITGSQDHTLKVLSMYDGAIIFTLHGHYGPVTAITLSGDLERNDPSSIGIAIDFGGVGSVIASGAQDGSLCVWDLITGTCVYSVQAHDGNIVALTCSSSYILSLGIDDKLCVWERFQGHLLNTLIMNQMYCSCMVMLTNRLLITSQQGSLTVWDIAAGMPIRLVKLGDKDHTVFIKYLIPVAGSIVCDYGNQLRVVRLLVNEKFD